jgi:hypothetical protein
MVIFSGGPVNFGCLSQEVKEINSRHSMGRIKTLFKDLEYLLLTGCNVFTP